MTKKNPAVSVIIPLYNAEKYIGECLTSLANQTFQDFEIIVADDCSTDNSRAVVEDFFCAFNGRLKLMRLAENGGCPGVPRNFALTEACGKYVYFLDGDDLLIDNALENLYAVAEKFSADVVHEERAFNFHDTNLAEAKLFSFQTCNFVTEPTLETFDIGKRLTTLITELSMWQAWGKLFRRQFLVDNNITFPALKRFEDFVFEIKCLVAAKNYVRVPFVSYCYRVSENSLSHKVYDVLEIVHELIKIFRTLDAFMSDEQFFRDNPQFKYKILDFLSGGQLDLTAKGFFVLGKAPPAAIYNYLRDKIFSCDPQDNVALTSYLFVAAQLLKLQTNQQAAQIDELNRQLAALKNNLEVSN